MGSGSCSVSGSFQVRCSGSDPVKGSDSDFGFRFIFGLW